MTVLAPFCCIRINKVPAGEAPLHIREKWVGLILPCDPYLGFPSSGMERGVLTGMPLYRNRRGYSVPQDAAIEILSHFCPDAAQWWKDQGFPQPDGYFGFAEDEAEIIAGVTRQNIIQVTEEMMGQLTR